MNKLNLLILLAAMIGGLSAVCPTIFGCRNCTDPTVCTDCETALKYFLQNGTCVPSSVTACRQIDTAGNCVNCFPDHILTNPQTCTPVASVAHCLTYNTTAPNALCLHCQVGYRLQNNTCILEVVNCLYMSADGLSCHLCAYGYTLVNNTCAPISGSPDPNCAIIDLYGTCHQCRPEYYFSVTTNICLDRSVPHCESYLTDTNTCVSCTSGYYLNAASTCSPQSINNCAVYVPNQNLCASCATGFTLNSTGLCAPSDPSIVNCQTLAASGLTCLICQAGYYLDPSGGCTPQQIPNCVAAVPNQNACATCQAGYYLVQELCVIQNIPNCLTYLANVNVCSACQPNFVLSDDGLTCTAEELPTIPHCLTYADGTQTACLTCAAGYYLVDNTCQLQNLPNCSVYVANLNACLTCNSGFQVSQGLCVPVEPVVIPHCLTYTDSTNSTCSVCDNGYYVSEGRCESQFIQDCAQYVANQNTCQVCATGFYLSQNQCLPQNIPNCLTYVANLNQCNGCLPDFTLVNDSCVHNELPTIPNCQTYTDASQVACATCQPGFYLADNACLPQNIPNCATYLPNVNQCQACAENFSLINNVCVENQPGDIAHCLTYSDATNTVCIACDSGYLLVDNTCQLQIIVPPNCAVASQDQSNTCIRCNSGYYLNNGLCSPVSVDFCLVYTDNTNTCTQCIPGYHLENNVCVLNQVISIPNCLTYTDATNATCAICADGYYLAEGVCAANSVANCLTYTPNTNTCLVCQSGFNLNGNTCVVITPIGIPFCITYSDDTRTVCITCSAGYYLSENQCFVYTVTNCQLYVPNVDRCAICASGYELVQGLCQLIVGNIPNCATYSDATQATCVTCAVGYYLSDNQCLVQSVANCQSYVPNVNQCATCASGYELIQGLCQLIVVSIPNCAAYSDASQATCITCAAGYYLSQNQCWTQSLPNCQSYVPNANQCATCVNGYELVQGVCQLVVVIIPNCATYSDATQVTCVTCAAGYYLTNNSCQIQNIPQCATYVPNANACAVCASGFHLEGVVCAMDVPVVIPNCNSYSSTNNAVCAICDLGYFLTDNTCQPQSVPNCLTYVPNFNLCTLCANGFQLQNGVCQAVVVVGIPNCAAFIDETNTECLACFDSFYLLDNRCLPQSVLNCLAYQPNTNLCVTCVPGFHAVQGFCISDSQTSIPNCATYTDDTNRICVVCDLTYYLASNACLPQAIPNCATYLPNNNVCTSCVPGFQLVNNVCTAGPIGTIDNCEVFTDATNTTCSVCELSYYLSENQCLPQSLPNCITYEVNANSCTFCETDYQVSNGLCVPIPIVSIPFCGTYTDSSNTTCTFCVPGYYLANNQCLEQNLPNCLVYTPNENNCQTCQVFFYRNSEGRCQQTVGCVQFASDSSDVCIQCGGGTLLYNGRCIDPSNPNCRIFQLDSLICQVCSDGFYLDVTGHCTAQNIAGCLTYVSQANQCQVCNPGYTLTNIGTCNPSSSIPNCDALSSAGDSCDTCHSGFYPSADRTQCLPQSIANCVSYQANANVCTACGTGFQVAANGVCTAMDDGKAHCIVWQGPSCLTCDVNYWPLNDLSSCYAIPKSLLMVPARNGNYDNLVIDQGQIKTGLQAGQGDSHDWVFNDLGNRRFYIGSADGNFGLTIRNGILALEAGSAVTDQTTWEITYNGDGFFFLRNIATNLYLASADFTSTVPIEILFYVSA